MARAHLGRRWAGSGPPAASEGLRPAHISKKDAAPGCRRQRTIILLTPRAAAAFMSLTLQALTNLRRKTLREPKTKAVRYEESAGWQCGRFAHVSPIITALATSFAQPSFSIASLSIPAKSKRVRSTGASRSGESEAAVAPAAAKSGWRVAHPGWVCGTG